MAETYSPILVKAGYEQSATKIELDAAVECFKAECLRGDATRLGLATDRCHAALQAYLDASASLAAIVRRETYGS